MRAFCLLLYLGLTACESGLAPPPPPAYGAIAGTVTYTGNWPSADSLVDLRFVAFRFVPRDTSDFFRFTEFEFGDRLRTHVAADAFVLDSVETGTFVYSGVAQRFGGGLLDWRPIGLVDTSPFTVAADETTFVHVRVDFDDIPPFPPR